MTTFDDREQGYEKKFAHDEEMNFKVTARRNKLLGLWAAELLGLPADKHEAFAKEVVIADLEEAGDGDVVRKLMGDFEKAGVPMTEKRIREEMARLQPIAKEQVFNN